MKRILGDNPATNRKLVIWTGLILLFIISLSQVRNREIPALPEPKGGENRGRKAHEFAARQLLERQAASRLQRLNEVPNQRPSGASHMRSLAIRKKLHHVAGIISQPGFSVSFAETNVWITDIVDWYPFLIRSDGSTNMEGARKVQNAVYEYMEQVRTDAWMRKTNGPMQLQIERQRELERSREGIKSASMRLVDLVASYEVRPQRIVALQPLTDISRQFSNLSVSQMRGMLSLLGDAQSFADRGADTKPFEASLKKWAATTNPTWRIGPWF